MPTARPSHAPPPVPLNGDCSNAPLLYPAALPVTPVTSLDARGRLVPRPDDGVDQPQLGLQLLEHRRELQLEPRPCSVPSPPRLDRDGRGVLDARRRALRLEQRQFCAQDEPEAPALLPAAPCRLDASRELPGVLLPLLGGVGLPQPCRDV